MAWSNYKCKTLHHLQQKWAKLLSILLFTSPHDSAQTPRPIRIGKGKKDENKWNKGSPKLAPSPSQDFYPPKLGPVTSHKASKIQLRNIISTNCHPNNVATTICPLSSTKALCTIDHKISMIAMSKSYKYQWEDWQTWDFYLDERIVPRNRSIKSRLALLTHSDRAPNNPS